MIRALQLDFTAQLTRGRGVVPCATVNPDYVDPPASCSFFITWSIENDAGFCRGGNSLNVCKNFPT